MANVLTRAQIVSGTGFPRHARFLLLEETVADTLATCPDVAVVEAAFDRGWKAAAQSLLTPSVFAKAVGRAMAVTHLCRHGAPDRYGKRQTQTPPTPHWYVRRIADGQYIGGDTGWTGRVQAHPFTVDELVLVFVRLGVAPETCTLEPAEG